MKRKVIKNTAKKVNPKKQLSYYQLIALDDKYSKALNSLKRGQVTKAKENLARRLGKQLGHTMDRIDRDIKGVLARRNTAKPVAKRNVAKKVNPKSHRSLSVPDKHQLRILLSNFKLVPFMRSHSLAETKRILKDKFGYSDSELRRIESRYPSDESLGFKNTTKRCSNSTSRTFNAEKLDDITRDFQGREPNGKKIHTVGSDYTPNVLTRLGKAILMIVKNGKEKFQIDFEGKNAFVGADARRNLYVEGKDAAIKNVTLPKKGLLTYLGKLQQIDYIGQKDHIENGEVVHYYHKAGEVDGIKSDIFVDHDGYPIFVGGNYDILSEGIAN